MATAGNKPVAPVTAEQVEALTQQYAGLRAVLDSETGPSARLTNCTRANGEGQECGKVIAFVVNLSRLRDHGLTAKGAFPLRPVDAKSTLSGEYVVNRASQHECLVEGAPRPGA